MSAHHAALPASEQAEALTGFDLFWSRYPNKFGRDQARAAWDELNPSPADQEAILLALAMEAGDRARGMRAGEKGWTSTAAVWLYSRELQRNLTGRQGADWRIALESRRSKSPRAAMALHVALWMAGVAVVVAMMAAGPALFGNAELPSAELVDALAEAHRIARYERVAP